MRLSIWVLTVLLTFRDTASMQSAQLEVPKYQVPDSCMLVKWNMPRVCLEQSSAKEPGRVAQITWLGWLKCALFFDADSTVMVCLILGAPTGNHLSFREPSAKVTGHHPPSSTASPHPPSHPSSRVRKSRTGESDFLHPRIPRHGRKYLMELTV
jgi:hypothetical protein